MLGYAAAVAEAEAPVGRPRRRLTKALVIAGSLLAVVAIFATWAERQALDTDDWVKTSGRLLEREAIRDAIANFAVDELYKNVDVEAELEQRLPKDFKGLSGPASSGLRELGIEGAQRALASARFQQIWKDANRIAHEDLIAIIEDRSDVVAADEGRVVLNLKPLIEQVATRLGIGADLAEKLPADAGRVTILTADQIGTAQTIAKAIRGAALVTSLLTLALFALAIYLSPGYRWITCLSSGVGLILAGLAVLILRGVTGGIVVDELAAESVRTAGDEAWSTGTDLLASIARNVMFFGVLFVLGSWLVSPAKSATGARRLLAPPLREYPAAIFTVLGLAALIWVLAGADSARILFTRLVLAAMAGFGLVALRRRALAEHPEATMAELRDRARERLSGLRRRPRPPQPEPEDRRLERLERLAALHERGALSDEEFAAEKNALAVKGPAASG